MSLTAVSGERLRARAQAGSLDSLLRVPEGVSPQGTAAYPACMCVLFQAADLGHPQSRKQVGALPSRLCHGFQGQPLGFSWRNALGGGVNMTEASFFFVCVLSVWDPADPFFDNAAGRSLTFTT